MKRQPIIMTRWQIKLPKPESYLQILTPQQGVLSTKNPADSILKAHYYLTAQTRKRIEDQVEKQLGKGEAAKRILSAFAPDYET